MGVGGDSAGGRMAAMVCHDLPEIDYQVITAKTDPQVIMAVLSSVLGAVNRSTVGVGGDGEGSRMAAIVCHEVPDLGYQVNMIHADAA